MFGRHSSHPGRIRPRTARSGSAPAAPTTDPSERREPAPAPLPADRDDTVFQELDRALAEVATFTLEARIPGSVVINPLLSVWDCAHRIGPEVATPVEELLTVAVHRSTLRDSEVIGCIEEVRAAALQHEVMSQFVPH